MRYRALDKNGKYQFGQNDAQFYVDAAEAVAQAVKTRLDLRAGEWYLDLTAGTPYNTKILGENTGSTYDHEVRERILGTPGVSSIVSYASTLDRTTRALSVAVTIATIYGNTTFNKVMQ